MRLIFFAFIIALSSQVKAQHVSKEAAFANPMPKHIMQTEVNAWAAKGVSADYFTANAGGGGRKKGESSSDLIERISDYIEAFRTEMKRRNAELAQRGLAPQWAEPAPDLKFVNVTLSGPKAALDEVTSDPIFLQPGGDPGNTVNFLTETINAQRK